MDANWINTILTLIQTGIKSFGPVFSSLFGLFGKYVGG